MARQYDRHGVALPMSTIESMDEDHAQDDREYARDPGAYWRARGHNGPPSVVVVRKPGHAQRLKIARLEGLIERLNRGKRIALERGEDTRIQDALISRHVQEIDDLRHELNGATDQN